MERLLLKICEDYPGGFDTKLQAAFSDVQELYRQKLAEAFTPPEKKDDDVVFRLMKPEVQP